MTGLLRIVSRRKRLAGIAIAAVLTIALSTATVVRHAEEASASFGCKAPPPAQLTAQSAPDPAPAVDQSGIAARFAPILRYDSREKLLPVDRTLYIEHAQLWELFDCRHFPDIRRNLGDVSVAALPETPLSCSMKVFRECHYYLKLRDVKAMRLAKFLPLQDAILADRGPTVYWHVDESARTVQYWFFYVFNAFLNQHQGDWEQATLQLDDSMSHITRVALSSHHGGQSEYWTQLQPGLGREGDHPIVYVARGSHANYFWKGRHNVPECAQLGCDRSDGGGLLLTPSIYRLSQLDGPVFAGDYSTGNFFVDGHKRMGSGINVEDPQEHAAWRSPGAWLRNALPVTH